MAASLGTKSGLFFNASFLAMEYNLSLRHTRYVALLNSLSIKNYALIDRLEVSFSKGFTVITGETGAGKSILLGGLSLVLGKRADLSSLRNKSLKCVVEAQFGVGAYGLQSFFAENDLDYEEMTIVRREISPSGKSRAFINDSPVTLNVLAQLGNRLIDVHSQHQTLQLTETDFQLKVIDALAGNGDLLSSYRSQLLTYQKITKELEEMRRLRQHALKEHDYNSFLLKELEAAPLQLGIQEELEAQYEQLSNVETILEQLSTAHQLLNDEQQGVLNLLSQVKQYAAKLSSFGNQFMDLNNRIQSVFIETDDIASELWALHEQMEANPVLLDEVNAKLQLLYDLQKKHGALGIPELIDIRENLAQKVGIADNIDTDILKKEEELQTAEKVLQQTAGDLGRRRNKVVPQLQAQLEESLISLGIPNASFSIELETASSFKHNGKDELSFLFSANKGSAYGELKKVASGGELSRIMLTIKSVLAKYEHLPTLMFDEIDTGVSGEISNRMGDIMNEMSQSMQIFSITHIPQVASKGDYHFKVYKEDKDGATHTLMKKLSSEERVVELAEMLGGKTLSDSAMAHARELLN